MTTLARQERFARVRAVFEELAELGPLARERRLREIESSDPAVAADVNALFDAAENAPDFLEPSTTSVPLEGQTLGAWKIVERIASGGMGEVYRAHRVGDDVPWQVAIKVLRRGFDGTELLSRFRDERRALASLRHPNIVSLIDVGTLDGGRPYFVMELVEGAPIDKYCADNGLDLGLRIDLFAGVCSAVEHAHQHLTAHCDLKPANILVTRDGHVKLVDFGIAELLSASSVARVQPMTRAYASPEQVRGEPIGVASDEWSLGVLLYELATGTHPFAESERAPRAESERDDADVTHPFIVPSRARAAAGISWAKSLRGDFDAVVSRCLRERPSDRYASVGALAADLRAFRAGRPVSARALSRSERWLRAIRSNRWTAVAIATAVTSLALATVLALREAARVRSEARLGWAAHAQAVEVTRLLEGLLLQARQSSVDPASLEHAIDAASQSAEHTFADAPETLGRLEIAFGALYLDLDQPDKARAALERGLTIAGTQRGFGRADVDRARALLARARATESRQH